MRLKTLNQKMEYLRNGVRYCLLLILLVLAFATGAHAAQDDYYYPNNSDYLQKARKYGHFTGYKN